jgi:hypothetical protein
MSPIVALLVLLGVLPVAWRAEGRAEAERDLAAGTPGWRLYGHLAGMTDEDRAFTRRVRDRYRVEVRVIGYCTVERYQVERAHGYNTRIKEAIAASFGADAAAELWVYETGWDATAGSDSSADRRAADGASEPAGAWYEHPAGRVVMLALVVVCGAAVLRRSLRPPRGR